jgi:hypothetical protein
MKVAPWLAALVVVCTGACSSSGEDTGGADSEINASEGPKLCAAVRGNGQSIVTHFASLSRIVEHFGVVDGIAGGSSGSITSFVYESILEHPRIGQCGGAALDALGRPSAACSDAERAARVSLTLKSVQGYGETVAGSMEGMAVLDLVGVSSRIKQELDSRGIAGLALSDVATAAQKLTEVLLIPEIRDAVNPDMLAQLADPVHLAFNVSEIRDAVTTIGAFSVDDNRLFFRTGALNWSSLAVLFGRVGDFYAGLGPSDAAAMGTWLDVCAPITTGKGWEEAAAVTTGGKLGAATCGDAFAKLVNDYRAKVRSSNAPPARLSAHVAEASSPVKKLLAAAVLEGAAVDAYKKALAEYRSGSHATGDIPFAIRFEDVKLGYWGADEDVAKVTRGGKFTDLKSKKASSLGNMTWNDVLTRSPAEPGLSPFVALPDGRFTAGGWSDLAPSLALKDLGCERVVYVTREGDEGEFAMKIAAKLGMSEADWKELYDLGTPTSSYNVALQQSDGVWCTNWNAFGDFQQREMSLDAYNAPLEARPSFDGVPTLRPYDKTTPRTGKPGCTPGIFGGAKFPTFPPVKE